MTYNRGFYLFLEWCQLYLENYRYYNLPSRIVSNWAIYYNKDTAIYSFEINEQVKLEFDGLQIIFKEQLL